MAANRTSCVVVHAQQENTSTSVSSVTNQGYQANQMTTSSSSSSTEPDTVFSSEAVCNDFVCISSPNVERTIRQIVKDLETLREGGVNCYSELVTYSDAFISFKGREPYRSFTFNSDTMMSASEVGELSVGGGPYSIRVVNIEMTATDSVAISYRMQGTMKAYGGSFDVDVLYNANYSFNLISGRVINHTLQWDMSKTAPQNAFVFLLARLQYSVTRKFQDVSGAIQTFLDEGLDGNNNSNLTVDPRDPNKFFQQQDNTFQDAVQFCIALTLMYVLVKGLLILNT